ncbi:mechanosensitive ion channel family protein [Thalassotalea euphylliae]|uniref:mechanosensitive ion channel family protein n=1 Tax=Thalassotalea euphylliae TaxID=1655234 RepID=UPI003639073F
MLLRPLFLLCLFLFGSLSHYGVSAQEPESPAPSSQLQIDIDAINEEIRALSESLQHSKGDDFGAIQLQLFYKNEELRHDITKAISSQGVASATLKTLVSDQQKYTSQAIDHLNSRSDELTEEISAAKLEDKLSLLNRYRELQHFLDLMFKWSHQNIDWMTALAIKADNTTEALERKLRSRLRLLSASIKYYGQQNKFLNQQLAESPESEKANLQVNQLVIKQRLEISTTSMRSLVDIAADFDIETSEYKQLIFETTGDITYDLLNWKVMLTIVTSWSERLWAWLVDNAPGHVFQVLIFVIIILVAKVIAKAFSRVVSKAVRTKNLNMSQLMQDFFVSISGKTIMVIGFLIALSQIGLDLTPVLAGFGIAGVIIGFALQDTLSNLAAGMMLLIYRPFDVGDFVYAGGVNGKVNKMSLVNTTIRTFDNQVIIVPNSKIWGDVIKNVTHERIRRVDMVFGIGYQDDVNQAEEVLRDIIESHESILRSPEPMIKVHTLNTSSVDFIVRPWVKTDDYWDVYWDVTKAVKLRFDEEGITIPFPQQDVHLHMVKNELPSE